MLMDYNLNSFCEIFSFSCDFIYDVWQGVMNSIYKSILCRDYNFIIHIIYIFIALLFHPSLSQRLEKKVYKIFKKLVAVNFQL